MDHLLNQKLLHPYKSKELLIEWNKMAERDDLVRIANSFLLASPPGEFMEVVTGSSSSFYPFLSLYANPPTDIRTLLYDDSLLNDTALNTFKQWNTDQMLQVKSPNGGHDVNCFFIYPSNSPTKLL